MSSTPPPPGAHHILSYAQALGGGGVERALLRLSRGWLDAGRRVTLVIGRVEGPLAAEMPAGVDVIELGSAAYRALAALPAIVARTRPDAIFCPGNHYTAAAAWTRFRLGARCPPIVGKVSNAPERADYGPIMRVGQRLWLRQHTRFLDHAVAMTPATAEAAARAMRMRGRVTVIANPPAVASPGGAVPPVPPGRFILGVGRLAPQKRWDRLLAALPRLDDRDVALVILGEGPGRRALGAQARALGIADRVHLPGHAGDPFPAMARAAVLALTSDYEGVPGVLREALSLGTPVVTTESSVSVHEVVNGPSLGTIVARDDPDALVAALDHWLASTARPAPVPQPGHDAATRYLALFDRLARG